MGVKGRPGLIGITGLQGLKGDVGAPGREAIPGKPGSPGLPGIEGLPAPEGPRPKPRDSTLLCIPKLQEPQYVQRAQPYCGRDIPCCMCMAMLMPKVRILDNLAAA